MLYEFVETYREAIIAKTRIKVSTRPWPPASTSELENGLPMFLSQLAETLRGNTPIRLSRTMRSVTAPLDTGATC